MSSPETDLSKLSTIELKVPEADVSKSSLEGFKSPETDMFKSSPTGLESPEANMFKSSPTEFRSPEADVTKYSPTGFKSPEADMLKSSPMVMVKAELCEPDLFIKQEPPSDLTEQSFAELEIDQNNEKYSLSEDISQFNKDTQSTSKRKEDSFDIMTSSDVLEDIKEIKENKDIPIKVDENTKKDTLQKNKKAQKPKIPKMNKKVDNLRLVRKDGVFTVNQSRTR